MHDNVLVEIFMMVFMMVIMNAIHVYDLHLLNIHDHWALIMALTVVKKSMTASKAGENPGSAPNSDSSTRSRSSWSPVINIAESKLYESVDPAPAAQP